MRAIACLFLRVACGSLIVLWGTIKSLAPASAIHVSDKFYGGVLSVPALQLPLGFAEVVLGGLVAVGLLRTIALPLQALVLGAGLVAIWKYVLDPFGLYLVEPGAREPLFFPSLVVFSASLIVFREFDRFALDRLLQRVKPSL